VLTVARAALVLVPNMYGWGLNLQRFLSPGWAWVPWMLAFLALLPGVARRAEPAFTRAGESIARGSAWAAAAACIGAALFVLLLPDRVQFVGDFLLREGTIEEAGLPSTLFPQALPLDVALHLHLPTWLVSTGLLSVNGAARLIGAVEVGMLALLALAFARTLALRGVAALATAAAVFFGGYLGLYTGYSKANGELMLMAVAIAVLGLRAARTGRGVLALGILLAVGAFLHRSVLGFVPAVALAFVLGLRARPAALREPRTYVALALPVVAFAFTLARIVKTLTEFDPLMHLDSPEVQAYGGLITSILAGARVVDLPNVVVLLAPLAPALLVLALAWGRRLPLGREAALLATLAVPFIGLLLFVHPGQGAFRDYDTLSQAGMVLALLGAWLAGETLRRARPRAWVGVGLVLAVAAPSVQWLAHQTDIDRGLARVEAFMTEPPARDEFERGKTWDYLGIRNWNLERWEASARAFARAAETQPSPRVLTQWAVAETQSGNLRGAQEVFRLAIARDSTNERAWKGLFSVSVQLGELDEARRAAEEVVRRDSGHVEAREALRRLDWMESRGGGTPAPR
jgi:tetratricopeptide (TPR) repeat protein